MATPLLTTKLYIPPLLGAGCERPVAWVSLDEGDNDPARFLAYFVSALQTLALSQVEGIEASVGASTLGALQSPQPPPIEEN